MASDIWTQSCGVAAQGGGVGPAGGSACRGLRIIEDDAFIGSRSMVVESARVRTGAKLGAGVILTRSTRVFDAETGDELPRGEAPAWSVCVGSTRIKKFPGGEFGMPCMLVLKRLPEGGSHDKLALEEILRDHGLAG
ncbi:DapH/DapD/GlmU-related protein [Nocardia noduli]|uniref:DapH/DapD/GlmU-related protein n=1 Tax=Nocardia noduli TaxID=2815722 RepID=UPI0027E051BC|nr:DapH/DapD/GlmU-related protein [Nocardia noduli]